MDLAKTWSEHRKVIVIVGANVLGAVVLIVGAVWLYRATVVPEPPNVKTAAVEDIAEFMANPRMVRLSKTRQREFARKVIDHYLDPDRRLALARQFDRLSDRQARQVRENFTRVAVDQAVIDAREYSRLQSPKARRAYVSKKIDDWENLRNVVQGKDIRPRVGKAESKKRSFTRTKVGQGVPTSPSQVYAKILNETNPAERANLEQFATDIESETKRRRRRR